MTGRTLNFTSSRPSCGARVVALWLCGSVANLVVVSLVFVATKYDSPNADFKSSRPSCGARVVFCALRSVAKSSFVSSCFVAKLCLCVLRSLRLT